MLVSLGQGCKLLPWQFPLGGVGLPLQVTSLASEVPEFKRALVLCPGEWVVGTVISVLPASESIAAT